MDEDVFGLKVSMDDAFAVQVAESAHQVHHVLPPAPSRPLSVLATPAIPSREWGWEKGEKGREEKDSARARARESEERPEQ